MAKPAILAVDDDPEVSAAISRDLSTHYGAEYRARGRNPHAQAAPDADHVTVTVEDSGVGMPPAVLTRAFEAFYTTKDVGEGTGLGLDIARRIVVERHHGTIDVVSAPGRTAFTVRLPVQQP